MNKIFVINGLPQSGKTTFGKIVGGELAERGINFLHTSSIDPVKQLLRPGDKWNEEFQSPRFKTQLETIKRKITDKDWDGVTKDEYWRRVMSEFKIKLVEEFPTLINGWVLFQARNLTEPFVLFVDIREPENIVRFRDFCQNHTLTEVKSVLVRSDLGLVFRNYSDESVSKYTYDYIINNRRGNNGSNELEFDRLKQESMKFIELAILDKGGIKEIRN